jgi:hypothetical protein
MKIDAIGIGFRRCGSSHIHHCLNTHQDVIKPSNGLHFFSENYHEGHEWYRSKLPPKQANKILIEHSVSYSYPAFYEKCAFRISKSLPNTKIFFTLRNPIERAFSDYVRSINLNEIPLELSFEQSILKYPILLERGKFKKIISTYLNYFSEDMIYCILFDDFKKGPDNYLKPFFKFLDISQVSIDMTYKPTINKGISSFPELHNFIARYRHNLDEYFDQSIMFPIWKTLRSPMQKTAHTVKNMFVNNIEMGLDTRAMLYSHYEEDISWLSSFLKRDLSHWK